MEDLGGIIGTREQVLAAIQLQQRWRRQAAGGGGKVAPTPAKGVGGARWRSAPEVQDLNEVIGTREQVLACICIQRWRRRTVETKGRVEEVAALVAEVEAAVEAAEAAL